MLPFEPCVVEMPIWLDNCLRMLSRVSAAVVVSAPETVPATKASFAVLNCDSSPLMVVTEAAMSLSAWARTVATLAAAELRFVASALAACTTAAPKALLSGSAAYCWSAVVKAPIAVAGEVSVAAVESVLDVVSSPSVLASDVKPSLNALCEEEALCAASRLANSALLVARCVSPCVTPPYDCVIVLALRLE